MILRPLHTKSLTIPDDTGIDYMCRHISLRNTTLLTHCNDLEHYHRLYTACDTAQSLPVYDERFGFHTMMLFWLPG